MTAGERHVRLQRLRLLDDGERGLLTNARCLSEGVDVPTLDGVAFIDPRRSEVDIVQAVGRAIRLADDKTVGTIVIPVFIDTETDADTALNDSSFKKVWDVIKALRAHDEELGEQIDSFRRELGRRGGRARLPAKIHLDVSATIGADFAAAFDVRLVEKTSARWEFWFGLLERFTAEQGTARVAVDYVMHGYPLGHWASVQRGLYTKGQLSNDRQNKLESLPGWAWDVLSDKWDLWMRLMHQFVAEHGHANVPYPYTVGDYNLRSWVATQRGLYRRGELAGERIRELEALPGWSWDVLEDIWIQHYDAVREFSEREGHARPKSTYVENELRLGQWVTVQRRSRDQMSPDRVALLEALPGWSWNSRIDSWERMYRLLAKFTEREGHARVLNDHIEEGVRLGGWVSDQRSGRDQMIENRRKLLEKLHGWSWDARAEMWQRKFALLQQFQKREGDAMVPQGFVEDDVKLGSWTREQRGRRNDLSKERRDLLESVPGWSWDPYAEAWERAFSAIVKFANREGHARVPRDHREEGIKLGDWVAEQRGNKSKISDERRIRVEALPGWTWNAIEASWMAHLDLLRAWATKEGHSRVPVDFVDNGMKLGQWTRLRRREHKTLSPERQAQLEAIPGWYWGTSLDQIWNQKFDVLKKFVAREGHALVRSGHVEDEIKLGGWVTEQRTERENLASERIAKLESLPGWSWDISGDTWYARFELVKKFAAREGHSRVPQGHNEDGVAIGKWVAVQRSTRNKLSAERRALLEFLPGWSWDPHEDKWNSTYDLLMKYNAEHGTSRPPYDSVYKGVKIGQWVSIQRSSYAKGKLSKERRRKLEELAGWEWVVA
jgi:hypothetical protein